MRLEYSRALLELADQHHAFITNLMMTDEAHFHLSGFVNKQNCRFWASENSRVIYPRPLHPLRVTVWCGITAAKVIGPYFIEDDRGNVLTVNGERYRSMIQDFLVPELQQLNQQHLWFQQNGATAHTSRKTIAILRWLFPNRIYLTLW